MHLLILNFNSLKAQCQVATAGASRTLCVGTVPVMAANTATGGGIGTWTKISGSGVITNPNLPTTTITGLTAGISTFMWTITNGTCSTNSSMSFTVGPSTALAGPSQTICASAGSAVLAGNVPTIGTGLWVKVSGSGTISNPTQNNSTITGLTTGTTVLTWSVSYSSCAASVSNMTIVTKAAPTVANAGPSQTLCATTGTATATLAGNAPASGVGVWVLVSGSGTITNPNLRNTTVTNISPGITVLTWSISNTPCASSVSNMSITVNAMPSIAAAGPDQTVCISSGATLAANTPTAGSGIWTVFGGTSTVTTPTNPTSGVTGLSVGINDFRWTITNAPCASNNDVIRIIGTNTTSISNAGPNQTLCATTGTASTFLAGNAPTAGTGLWVKVSGSGTIANPSLRNSGLTNISPGVTILTWSISNNPCPPSTSDVTITTNAPPSIAAAGPDQTVCISSGATLAANTPTAGAGLWTVITGTATVTTPTSPTSGVTGLSVGNNTFRWTTSNAPCASSFDDVIIVGRALPSIAVAGGDQTVCVSTGSTTLAANTPTAGVGAWFKLSGSGTITNSLSPTSTLTGLTGGSTVLTWSISNSPCAATTDNVTITTNALPTIASAGGNQTVCTTAGTTMAANTAAIGTGAWTLISGSGTITNSLSPSTTITGLGVGTNVFSWTISNPPCANSVSNVTITGIAPPSISNAGSNQTLCISSPNTLMAANAATVGTGVWTLVSGSGTITNSLSPTTSITGLGLGTNVFAWTISSAPCAASSSTVAITVNSAPTAANAGSNQTLCISSPSTTMNANAALVGTGVWTLVSGAGTITNSLSPTTSVTGLAVGTNIFQWTISNAPCAASASTVAVIVSDMPTISNAGSNQTLCISSPTTTMNANTAVVGTGVWTLVSGSGTVSNSLSPTSSITGLAVGINIFQWTISNSPCPASGSNVTITVNQVPTISNAGSNQTLCISSPTTTMNANTPVVGTGVWTLISGSGTITNSLSTTTSVTGLAVGTNIFQWTISNAPCASSTSTVALVVSSIPTIANAGPNQTLCISNPNTVMAANSATIGTGVWTLVSGSGTITNSLSPTTSITGLGSGINVFQWTISNAPCPPSSSNVTITVNQVPSISNAGSDQTLCISSPTTTMNGNFPAVGTGAWSLISGTGVITNSLLPNTTVTGLGLGNNVFAWTISNAACASSSSNVTITVNQAPTIANAGSNQTLCISSPTTTMNGNAATVGTGVWTLVSGIGTITNSLSPTTSITGLGLGTNVFAWTISNSPCASSVSNVTLTVNQIPSASIAGSNQTLCISSPTTTMNGNFPAVGNGVWTLISGTGIITNSLLPTTTITGLGLGNNIFAWTVSNAPCASSSSNVTITVNQAPTISNAGSNQTLCVTNPNAVMSANTATAGTGVWTLVSGAGVITNSLSPTTSITGLGLGNNVFAWTISNAPCAASASNVTITVNQVPTIASAGSNQTLCISSPSTTMNGNFPAVGTGAWTLVSGTGVITNSLLPTTTITGLAVGTNVFQWNISNAPCLASSATVAIIVRDMPTTSNAGASQTICISSPNTLMAANTATVGTGVWTLVSGIGTITNSLSPTTSITGLGLGTNIFQWTISNSPCSASSSTVAIIVKDIPTVSNAGTSQTLCISSPTTIMNANTAVVGTGVWTLVSGTGVITNTLSPTTSITGLGLGNNVFAWTISNNPCSPSTSNVTLTVNQAPTLANAGGNQTLCITSPNTLMTANTAIVGTGVWTLVSGSGTITNSLSPTTSITGLGLGTNIFAWTISNVPCVPSVSNVTLTVNQVPTIANAGTNQTLCISSPNTTMAANTAVVGTGVWTLVSGTGVISNSLSPTTSITGLGLGNNVFAWTISNNPCAPSSSNVTITVNQVPTIANAGSNQTLCITSPNTLMAANTATVGTGVWTLVSGTGVITNSLSPTTSVTGLGLGTNVFAWTISNSPCASSVSNVTITVNQVPTIANAGSNQTLCISAPSTTMNANTPIVGNGVWTIVSGSGTITNSLSATTSITGIGLGTNVFAWTISNNPCAPSTSNVTITVNQIPTIASAGSNQTLCITSPNTIMAANTPVVGTGAWALISGSGTIANSLSPTTSITGLGLGTNIFAWTISNAPCASSTSTVAIFVNDVPTTSNAGVNQTVCFNVPTATMTANTATVGTGVWTLVSGTGVISNSLSPTTPVSGLGLGTNVFAWTISNSPCANSVSNMTIMVNPGPTISNAGTNQTLCISSPSTTMTGNTPTSGNGVWTLVSGTGVITNSVIPNTTITGLGLGTNVFAWTIYDNPCIPSSSTVALLVNDVPTIANAGPNQTVCVSSPTTIMTANTATVGTGVWTILSGTATITNSLSPTTSITGMATGVNVFAWTISNPPCAASVSTVSIRVRRLPTVSVAGPNQTLCITNPNTVMAANSALIGNGVWTLVSGSGVITNTASPTTAITGLGLGANVFAWTISNSPCASSSSNVTITVNNVPTIASAGPSQTICISSPNTSMAANNATVGTGAWSLLSGSGTITNSLSPTTSVTGLGLGTNVFQWTISNAPCAATSSTMAIEVKDVPTISNAGPSQTICISTSNVVMAANPPGVGTGVWTLVSGSGTISNPTSPTTSIFGLAVGTNVFAWTISNSPCASSTSTVAIEVKDLPTISTAGSAQTLCISNPNTTMTANTATVGIGVWTLVSGTGVITNSLSPTTPITGLGLGTNIFDWTISNSPCTASSSTMAIIVKDMPTVSNAGFSQTVCISSPNAFMNANTATVGVGTWSLISGSGTITNSLSPTTSVMGLGLGLNVFAWTISNPPCAISSSTMSILVNALPTVANAGTTQTLCISSSSTTMTGNTPTTGTGLWTLLSGSGTITNPTLENTTITGLGLGTNVFAWTISNAPCLASTATVALIVNDMPTVSNAGPTQTLCISSPTTVMTANTPTVGTGLWTLTSGSGTITNPTSPNSTITGLGLGVNVFDWTISNAPCLASVSSVTIFVNALPTPANAGPSQNLCASTFTLNGNNPAVGTGAWTVIAGTGIVTTPNLYNSQVTTLLTGTNTLVWTISNGVCASSSSSVNLYVNPFPTPANAGPDQTICTSTAVLNGNSPAIGFGNWTVVNGGGSVTTGTLSNSTVTGLTNGVNTFVWTTIFGTCPNSPDTVVILVDSLPTPAIAGTNQVLCSPTATLNANIPVVGIGTWSVIAGGSSITTPTLNSSGVSGLATGNNIFEWSVVNGVCPASTSTVSVFVDSYPSPSNAGTDFTICASTSTLNSNIPTIGTAVWSVITGTSSVATATLNSSGVTGLSNGANTFVWTTSNGTCPNSTDTVIIFVDSIPTISIAGLNQTICSPTTTLSSNIPVTGIGTWSVITGGSSVNTPTLNSSLVTGLATGNNIFEWTIANGVCPASTSTVSVFVDSYPTVSTAGSDFTICASSATLNSNIPTIGAGAWTVISGGSSVTSPSTNSTSVTGLSTGTNSLVWTIANGTCPSSMDTVNIQVDDFASPVNAGPDQAFCFTTTSVNLNGSIPSVGVATWSVMTGGGTLANPNSNTSTISGLTTGTNTVVWTNTNGVCPATSDTVTIELLMFPTPANAGPDQTLCPNSTALAGNLPSIGFGTWSIITGTGSIATTSLNTSGVSSLSTGTNSLVWTTWNGDCPTSADTVQLIVLPPVQQAFAGNDTTIYVTSLNINGNLPITGTGVWQFVGGSFNINEPSKNSTQLTNLVPGVNTVKWTITESCGSTSDELNITLVVLQIPNAISPNGDGINDYLEIPINDFYKQVEVKIVNRWGNVEFEDREYKNTWNGVNQDNQPLTEDTYFYVIKLDGQVQTGYILIKR